MDFFFFPYCDDGRCDSSITFNSYFLVTVLNESDLNGLIRHKISEFGELFV